MSSTEPFDPLEFAQIGRLQKLSSRLISSAASELRDLYELQSE
jgi:hypothetical protein